MASLKPLSSQLSKKQAAHLLRRTTLGFTYNDLQSFIGLNIEDAINILTSQHGYDLPNPPLSPDNGNTWIFGNDPTKNSVYTDFQDWWKRYYIAGWIIENGIKSTPHICDKLVLFYHTIYPCSFLFGDHLSSVDFASQYRLFRHYTNGSLKDLAEAMCYDIMMATYLDLSSNIKGAPNENFAREFLELFTILKGEQVGAGDYTTYTEQDVQEAARLFTGIKINKNQWHNPSYQDPATGIARCSFFDPHHDNTNKTFSNRFGNKVIVGRSGEDARKEVTDFVNMVFDQNQTSISYVERIYRFFVRSEISQEVKQDIIIPLAQELKINKYNITHTLKKLLSSEHFFDLDDPVYGDDVYGAIVRSPLELHTQIVKQFNIERPSNLYELWHDHYKDSVIQFLLAEADMPFWIPPNVAGYLAYYQAPGYSRNWITPSTLPFRYKTAEMYITGDKIVVAWDKIHIKLDIVENIKQNVSDASDPKLVFDYIVYPLIVELSVDRFTYFYNDVFLDNKPEIHWTQEWNQYISSGNNTVVKQLLENLFVSIIQSPEFQLI